MITEKGAIVVIVYSVLTLIAIFAQLQRINFKTTTSVVFAMMATIIFPVVGIADDTFVGRFKAFRADFPGAHAIAHDFPGAYEIEKFSFHF